MAVAEILEILIYIALAGVVAALLIGVVSMFRGGDFNRKYGNHFMRWRVGLQATVVLLLVLLWLVNRS
ncbi:MAG: twin transmembrane helix small protein [Alphaproteobacteria bacterium]|nr:twin transmembrane helix small protein [Alphaproteobacteria bacterium]